MSRILHDGAQDGLEALCPLDVKKTNTVSELLAGMSKTAFGGRRLGEALDVLEAMVRDPDCFVVVTMSGAMTIAKMGLVLCDMIENGAADAIVSTGAIMAHGLSEATGGVHYKHDPSMDDNELFAKGYNRVFDTLEMEANLSDTERFVRDALNAAGTLPDSSHAMATLLGQRLHDSGQMPSILGCAYAAGVPVFVPAFTDSELGLDVATYTLARADKNDLDTLLASPPPVFNPFGDLYAYAAKVAPAKRLGIFTIGGGVPRNWAQQVGPFIDLINGRLGCDFPVPRFHYGVRICPEPVHWGGLSGCSYSEGISWGKFVPPDQGGQYAEVHSDATIAWPLLVRGLLERLDV
ncbi:MAG: deoxyhypusine synthase [Rhodothermales bacterium]|jgi:deoxyhypusine synthase